MAEGAAVEEKPVNGLRHSLGDSYLLGSPAGGSFCCFVQTCSFLDSLGPGDQLGEGTGEWCAEYGRLCPVQ